MSDKSKTKKSSASKRQRQDIKRAHRNHVVKSKVKTALKDFTKLLEEGDSTEKLDSALSRCYSTLDKACKHNVFSKNKAARYKSRVSCLLNK